jgi:hypothetical protein
MRIEIKTPTPITDRDVRALILMAFALQQCTPRMIEHNLRFIADRHGYELIPKLPKLL